MGFNKVYRLLQEVFPQVDARALRAVAIEHSKDADAAVEAVLFEIIPFFTERSVSDTAGESTQALAGAIATTQTAADCTSVNTAAGSIDGQNDYIAYAGYQDCVDTNDGHSEPLCDTFNDRRKGDGVMAELTTCGSVHENNMPLNTDICSHDEAVQLMDKDRVNALQIEDSVELKMDKTTSDGKYPASSIQLASDTNPCQTLGTSEDKDAGINQNVNILRERAESSCLDIQFDTASNKNSDQGKNSGDVKTCLVGPSSFIAHDITVSLPEEKLPLLQELDGSLPNNSAPKVESSSIIVGSDDKSTLNGSMLQSSKIHMIDALVKIIADARNNKKMLFSAMDSVISLMKEVDLKEKVSEQAKVEATIGGADILMKSEELKQTLKQAEETNSMHAGEVYGEKAVLATELRELQSRALSLSIDRDKYLAVLDEMQQTLEVRLAEAQNVIKSAEKEKIERENAATESLAEQELIMEKVLQESKRLNQQAEDNAKLREFLVDRGRVVDMLQGEISVICQDVKLLKEKFDEQIPFNKSLTSSQTSCILASSSGSSSKSLIPEEVMSLPGGEVDPMDTEKKQGTISCWTEHSSQDEAGARDYSKALSDDEWELFDRDMFP